MAKLIALRITSGNDKTKNLH